MSCYESYRSSRNFNFDKQLSYKGIKREHDKARRKSCSSYEFDRIEDDLYKQASESIPFFGDDIGALTYLAWEKEIDGMHSFMVRKSKSESFYSRDSESYILSLYTSSFKKHAREWWDDRQYHVKIGRKYPIYDWNELKACMRRKFVPREIERNLELMRGLIRKGESFIQNLSGFSRRESEFLEKLRRLWEERSKYRIDRLKREKQKQEVREQREKERKEEGEQKRRKEEERERREEEERREKERKEAQRREKEEVERIEMEEKKRQLKATSPPTLEARFLRGGFLFSHFSPFIFEFSKIHFSFKELATPSLKMLSLSTHAKFQLGLWLPLWLPITQDTNKISNEERFLCYIKIKNFKIWKPSSTHILLYILLGQRKLIKDMFDAYCRWIFDPGGTLMKLTKISLQKHHQI
ncbi:stress response protein NST1-like [Vigna angularis]|uniref:stress response protein NST1-like n=1 Tax=Phaseolus angularis TaxID=3914 RepID=UPI0022B48D21|nr:stress response protein NST1-like [Vigna angularis]